MSKQLKHYVRTHVMGEDGYKTFALIGFNPKENDSCVTLVRCKAEKVKEELRKWGSFNTYDLWVISKMVVRGQYKADAFSTIIRLA